MKGETVLLEQKSLCIMALIGGWYAESSTQTPQQLSG
jgi:hypothetical protein